MNVSFLLTTIYSILLEIIFTLSPKLICLRYPLKLPLIIPEIIFENSSIDLCVTCLKNEVYNIHTYHFLVFLACTNRWVSVILIEKILDMIL